MLATHEQAVFAISARISLPAFLVKAGQRAAKAHVDLRRSLPRDAPPASDPIVNPAKLPPARANELCGQCHGVFIHKDEFAMEFARKGNLFRPGEAIERTRHYPRHPGRNPSGEAAAELRSNPHFFERRWWPDGQMLAGGREFSAMRESGCTSKGNMSCLDCHSMHEDDPNDQLRPGCTGPEACIQCHKEPRYNADIASHTHHPAGSPGSDCLNCHMPHTSYALFKAIRNHRVSSPRFAPICSMAPRRPRRPTRHRRMAPRLEARHDHRRRTVAPTPPRRPRPACRRRRTPHGNGIRPASGTQDGGPPRTPLDTQRCPRPPAHPRVPHTTGQTLHHRQRMTASTLHERHDSVVGGDGIQA